MKKKNHITVPPRYIFAALAILCIGMMYASYATGFAGSTLGRITGKFKPVFVILFAVLLQISAYLFIALAPGIVSLYYMAVISGVFGAILTPVLNALSLKSAPATRSGAASATYWLGFDIGMAITPMIFGVVIDVAGYSASFMAGAVCMGVFAVCAVIALRKVKPLDEIVQPEED